MSDPQTVLVWDIETNVGDPIPTEIHLVVTRDLQTNEVNVFRSNQLDQAVDHLNSADVLVGHNSIMFDTVVTEHVTGRKITPKQLDTVLMSRVLWPDREDHIAGGNSLANWGDYLGYPKDDYTDWCKENGLDPWSEWRQEMQDYCIQDTQVSAALYRFLAPRAASIRQATKLEHDVAWAINNQIATGFGYDLDSAIQLEQSITAEKDDITDKLRGLFPDKVEPLRFHKTTGKPLTQKIEVFNPASRQQVASRMRETYGWQPNEFTEKSGAAKINEDILGSIDNPAAPLLERWFTLKKRQEQLTKWFQYCHDGAIHGGVITNGTVSGRMSHQRPNLAQVPRHPKPYGAEIRALFRPAPGYTYQVGIDAAALELRMLAHYMAHWDDGDYARKVLESDIHTANQMAAGLETRDDAKTFIFALIYGAGDAKIGRDFANGSARAGKKLKESFYQANPAFKSLRDAISFQVKKNKGLVGLDGRFLPIRSPHKAMNQLLQSAGAVLMKQALVLMDQRMPDDASFMANIHDEWQMCCDSEPDRLGSIAADCIREAGEILNLKIPMEGKYMVGNNWGECH